MIRITANIATTLLLLAGFSDLALGQAPPTILAIDLASCVEYQADIYDASKYGKNSDKTPSAGTGSFGVLSWVTSWPSMVSLSEGYTLSDRGWLARVLLHNPEWDLATSLLPRSGNTFLKILQTDGTPNRRLYHQAGTFRFTLHIIPMYAPQILTTANGPAVVHSNDFTPVSASKPAAAGEVLSLFATGLGPVNPSVDPGQLFPSSRLAAVNSPVDVTVNGEHAEVLAAVGFPGTVDGYQVNFRVPPDAAKGAATIQVSAAWIAGAPVRIPVQ